MSYALLGNACHATGSAFISNHKYLPPLDPIYFKPYTQMNKYPGQSIPSNRGKGRFTEKMKTFYGKNSNPITDIDRNTISTINPPRNFPPMVNEKDTVQDSNYTRQETGKCTSCSFGKDKEDNLFPILDPMFNLREVAKHLILLEDHLFHSGKRCTQCIIKHLLTIEAFLEEAVTLDKEQQYVSKINNIYTNFKNIQKTIHDQISNNSLSGEFCKNIAQKLRAIRKPISLETYNLC